MRTKPDILLFCYLTLPLTHLFSFFLSNWMAYIVHFGYVFHLLLWCAAPIWIQAWRQLGNRVWSLQHWAFSFSVTRSPKLDPSWIQLFCNSAWIQVESKRTEFARSNTEYIILRFATMSFILAFHLSLPIFGILMSMLLLLAIFLGTPKTIKVCFLPVRSASRSHVYLYIITLVLNDYSPFINSNRMWDNARF